MKIFSPPRLSYTDENANDNFFFALCGLLAGFFKRHSPKDSKNRGSFGRKTRALQRPPHRGLVPDFLKYRKTKCVSLSLFGKRETIGQAEMRARINRFKSFEIDFPQRRMDNKKEENEIDNTKSLGGCWTRCHSSWPRS